MNRELMSVCIIVMLSAAFVFPIVVVPTYAVPEEVYVVAADYYGRSNYILSYGNGTFSNQEYIGQIPQPHYTYGCGIGDFDNDGEFDYVIGTGDGEHHVYLYEKLGPGNDFASPVSVGTWTEGLYPMDFAVADYDNDGNMDFVLTHYGSSNDELYLGNGDLTFTRSVLTDTSPLYSIGADSADFNNDGNPDFASAQYGWSSPPVDYWNPDLPYSGTNPYYIYVNLGNGDGTFNTTSFEASSGAWGITAADFDNDGYADIIAGGMSTYGWYFYKGNGDGTFQPGVFISDVWSYYSPIDNYDFDNDGLQDIILGYTYSVLYYYGNGDGTFTYETEITGGIGSWRLAISAPAEIVPRRPGGPIARFTWYPKKPRVNELVTFNASRSRPGWNGTDEMPIVSYAWDFGDGTTSTGMIVTHAFSAVGTYSVTLNVTDSQGLWHTKTHAIEVVTLRTVIKDGVAWLAAQQNPDGSWGWWYPVAQTSLAVLKLEEHAVDWKYGYGLPSPFHPDYPYREHVEKGLNYIFSKAYVIDIDVQPAGDPDVNGNGKGVYFVSWAPWHLRTYETGIAMMAIAGSRAPDRVVSVSGSRVDGWTYKDVLQDAVDYLAFSQNDEDWMRGGWGYADEGGWRRSDQSNSGWATFGLGFAESPEYKFGCTIPDFVKTELSIWIDYIQNDVDGDLNDGGAGYKHPDEWVNILKTGHLLYMMALVGDNATTPRVQDAVDYLVRWWDHPSDDPGWRGPGYWTGVAGYHAMFNVMKGLFTLGIHEIDGIDWQREFEDVLINQQLNDGSWPVTRWDRARDRILSTEWALLTLQKVAPPPIRKELSPTEGALGDVVHVKVEVMVAPGETATVVDTLPLEWNYINGTFTVNGVSETPTVTVTPPPPPRSQVISYNITTSSTIEFDAKVTEAYWEDRTVINRVNATWYDEAGNIVDQREATADFVIHAFEELDKKVYVELLKNGDFSNGLANWMVRVEYGYQSQIHTGEDWEVIGDKGYGWTDIAVIDEDARKNVLDIKQEISDGDGDWTGVFQVLDIDVSGYDELYFEADGKAMFQSLPGDGWVGGEYPVHFIISYEDVNGVQHDAWLGWPPNPAWQQGFYYTSVGDPDGLNPYSNKVTQNVWFHYKSPNLMNLSPAPKIIKIVRLYSSGWAYHGRIDNARLYGTPPSLTIKEKTEVQWALKIEVTNTFPYTMTDAVIKDRFGAEIEIDEPFPVSITHGTASYTTKGKSEKVFLTWEIGDLQPGDTARLVLLVSTDINPSGKQEYSEPGIYELNSGATLKFIDPEQDMELSACTDSIYVTVVENP
jgi:PKD repeat protein